MSGVVRFGADGLVPAVVQDVVSGDVLMLAFMNEEALRRTRETGRAHYWSRSRGSLWRKGETSGNEQIVTEIRVNCEENSLLLLVRQIGAVCHTGYPTCYFRRVEADGALTIIRERAFDPRDVYESGPAAEVRADVAAIDRLAEATRLQYGAYAYLRDHDLTAISGTSRRLRHGDEPIARRVADELRELADVLTGEHRHADPESDLRLEASQVLYWVLLAALGAGVSWSGFRSDRALTTAADAMPAPTVAKLLHADANHWMDCRGDEGDLTARCHATLALVGQACRSGNVDPASVVEADLAELRGRAYLAPYFDGRSG
jgi:phosphoribosyl-AMP cyclohydrolase/phosphoribosyl-ATP pyrophosphohydrolase